MQENEVIIVKVGTGVLTLDDGTLNLTAIENLVTYLAELEQSGKNVILVSSGAVGAGVPLLKLDEYPQDISTRQAAAAIGQARLMQTYQSYFDKHGLNIAQILLSSYDLREEKHKERAQTVLAKLLEQPNVIPIVNENDVVSLRELTKTDNDMLAANLSVILKVKSLILLTSVDGLLNDNDEVITQISDIDEAVAKFVKDDSGKFSIGGMKSKLDAVRVAKEAGVKIVIGNGDAPERLMGYLTEESLGTYF